MKYQLQVPGQNGSYVTKASFANRSAAVDFAEQFKNVRVIRKTEQTNRTVFSRSTSVNNGFMTVTQTETVRIPKA